MSVSRRDLLGAGLLAGAANWVNPQPASASLEGTDWPLWPALPIAPYSKRKTLRREVTPGRVWTFDQIQGIFYVHVVIRMTVVAMDQGGLFVYAPVAPTQELMALMQDLVTAHGPVKYIVLPSVAPEHKVLAGPFAQKFPKAEFWVTDRQYSFPVDLPPSWLGQPSPKLLPASGEGMPWGDEFDHAVLTVKPSRESIFQEAAFFHKPSKTLLLCDTLISTGKDPPDILLSEPEYRRALLYHARDGTMEKVSDTPEVWRKGWQRIALFANFFMPGSLVVDPSFANSLAEARQTAMPELGWGGLLPFAWRPSTPQAFEAFRNAGKPVVAPIIQIILSRGPRDARSWLAQVMSWEFEKVVPAHFDVMAKASHQDVQQAFDFLQRGTNNQRVFCDEDVLFLREALEGLPPNLALAPTDFGPLQGPVCGLESKV